jgi:hypothetical protein
MITRTSVKYEEILLIFRILQNKKNLNCSSHIVRNDNQNFCAIQRNFVDIPYITGQENMNCSSHTVRNMATD